MNFFAGSVIVLIPAMAIVGASGCASASAGSRPLSPARESESVTIASAEDRLGQWAEQYLVRERARVAILEKAVETADRALRSETTQGTAPGEGRSAVRRLHEANLIAAQISLDVARTPLELCTSLITRELQIAAYNRAYPADRKPQISEERKEMCGGPDPDLSSIPNHKGS